MAFKIFGYFQFVDWLQTVSIMILCAKIHATKKSSSNGNYSEDCE